jgi:hypothetical protein
MFYKSNDEATNRQLPTPLSEEDVVCARIFRKIDVTKDCEDLFAILLRKGKITKSTKHQWAKKNKPLKAGIQKSCACGLSVDIAGNTVTKQKHFSDQQLYKETNSTIRAYAEATASGDEIDNLEIELIAEREKILRRLRTVVDLIIDNMGFVDTTPKKSKTDKNLRELADKKFNSIVPSPEVTTPAVADGISELTDHVQRLSLKPLRERAKVAVKLIDDEAEEDNEVEEDEEDEEEEEDEPEEEYAPTAKAQTKRPPRIAKGEEKHRHHPEDQYYTPRGAVLALIKVLGAVIFRIYTGKE